MKNIKKYYFLLIPFLFLFQLGMAALSATDSLEKKLATAVGESRVELLNELSFNISNKDLEKSFQMAKEALELSIKLNYDKGKACALNNFGLCYYDKSKYDSALYYYIQSLKLEEKLGNKKRIAVVNGNIGLLYSGQMNYPKALEYLEKACESQKELGNKDKEAACQNNIGIVYYKLEVYYKALEKFKAAAALYKELNDKENMSSCLSNIGVISQDLKDYKTALEYYMMALKTNQEYDNKEGIAISYQNIGTVYDLLGEHDKAIEYQQKGMELAKQINAKDLIDYAYVDLGEAYKNKKNIDSTYKYLMLYANYKDTIFNAENNKNVADMQTKYETEKKEAQIKLLNKDKERQQIVLYAVVFGLLLVIALAFFIFRGYKQKQRANSQLKEKNSLIEEKNKIVEEKNKDITDSIRYAKRLQTAILKPADTLTNYFEDGFILFKPKDIVSGDFYWFEKFGNLSMVAAADCTGHGVPGAFMSIIGCNLLSQAVNEYAITKPEAILNSINKGLTKVLQQKGKGDADSFVTDGMDIALCSFNPDTMMVEYSGAFNPMWLIRDNKIAEYTADKFPVGAFVDSRVRIFNCHEIPVKKGDMIYIFSDGFADQFGGPLGKKFKYKSLQNILLENSNKSCMEQKIILNKTFEDWIGDLEQIDDVLVIGIRI